MIGWLSGVASSTSFHILMDLSHSAVIRRLPVLSKLVARIPHSDSREPGWSTLAVAWKLLEDFQSQNLQEMSHSLSAQCPRYPWCEAGLEQGFEVRYMQRLAMSIHMWIDFVYPVPCPKQDSSVTCLRRAKMFQYHSLMHVHSVYLPRPTQNLRGDIVEALGLEGLGSEAYHREPLSPPVAMTPSSLIAMQLTMVFCCCRELLRKVP